MATRKRTRARELALQFLYQLDVNTAPKPEPIPPAATEAVTDAAIDTTATAELEPLVSPSEPVAPMPIVEVPAPAPAPLKNPDGTPRRTRRTPGAPIDAPPPAPPAPPMTPREFLTMQTDDDAVFAFAESLIESVLVERERIDRELTRVAARWDLKRMPPVDRNILRIGVAELLLRHDIPPQVTLNEAIELAKRFSTAKSGQFVNGLLDRIRADLGREPTAPRGASRAGLAPEPEGETADLLPHEDPPQESDDAGAAGPPGPRGAS